MARMSKGTSPRMHKRGGEIGHLDGSEGIGTARGHGNDRSPCSWQVFQIGSASDEEIPEMTKI